MSLTFGAAIPGTFALYYPRHAYQYDKFDTDQYYRIIWSSALVVSALQWLLMGCVFRQETPVFLKQKGKEEELLTLMKKYYKGNEVKNRIDALAVIKTEGNAEAQEVSIKETFTDPEIRSSAWVGFWLVTFQQLTGINSVLFYSGQTFGDENDGLSPAEASCIINWANCLAAGIGAILLNYFGRKTLMIGSQLFCVIGMFGMWFFQEIVEQDAAMMVLLITFIFAFEFGSGPVVWLYLSEICNDKATSVNTVVNWIWTLLVGAILPPILNNAMDGYVWLMFGCFSAIGFVYIAVTMKETMGVPKDKLKTLYNKSNKTADYDPIR